MRNSVLVHAMLVLLLCTTLPIVGCQDGSTTQSSSTAVPASTVATQPAALPAPTTASVTVSWDAPTENTNGTALTDLSGFKVYYGTDPKGLTRSVTLSSPGLLTYVIDGLAIGVTYYFAVTALTSDGAESAYSSVVAKAIT
jgi:hypothetical protein